MEELLAIDARASVKLPIRWTVGVHLPSQPHALPRGVLRFPPRGRVIVKAKQRAFGHLAELDKAAVDVLFWEVDSTAELEALAAFASARGVSALCFVGPDIPWTTWSELRFRHPTVAFLPREGARADVARAAGRITDQLVRERLYLQLLRHWRGLLQDYVQVGLAATDGQFAFPPVVLPPSTAPLDTIEHEHVAGVLGLWFDAGGKTSDLVEASYGVVRRRLGKLPRGLQRAIAPLPPLAGARLLVLEDDPALARSTARLLEAVATRLGRPLDIDIAASAEDAIARVEKQGAPALLWADVHLAGRMTGDEFVRWLRREKLATVVFGKTNPKETAAIESLYRLGALHVWCDAHLLHLPSALTSGIEAAAEAGAIRQGMVEAALLDGRLAPLVGRALAGDAAARRSREVSERVVTLMADRADRPASLGDAETTLEEVAAQAMRLACPDGANERAAAREIGVDVKTLRAALKVIMEPPSADMPDATEPDKEP